MRTVRLYGDFGRRYGKTHRFAVRSPAEAIRALCANFPGFQQEMIEAEKRGMGFRVINGDDELASVAQVSEPHARELKIIPAVIGAGGPTTRILIGAALIAASFFIPPAAGLAIGATTFTVAGLAFNVGVALALGGVAELLAPQPKTDGVKEANENAAYAFNGPVNTTAQGNPVPVGYGRLIVGGAVISAGISIEQQQQGKKRVPIVNEMLIWKEQNTDVVARQDPPPQPGFAAKVPDNSFGSDYLGLFVLYEGGGGPLYRKYKFYYYTWNLVDA